MEKEHCVSDLAREIQVTEFAVSHQLHALRIVRLVCPHKVGKNVILHIRWVLEETYRFSALLGFRGYFPSMPLSPHVSSFNASHSFSRKPVSTTVSVTTNGRLTSIPSLARSCSCSCSLIVGSLSLSCIERYS